MPKARAKTDGRSMAGPGRVRGPVRAALVATGILVALAAGPVTGAFAEGSGQSFDLDDVRRMMEDLKRKADEAGRYKRDDVPESSTAAVRVDDRDDSAGAPGPETPVTQDEAGHAVDSERAKRDREGEDVLEAIRRARAAREAWDDPEPILHRLPDKPPAPHSTTTPHEHTAKRPAVLPRDKGLPRPRPDMASTRGTGVLHPDPEAAPLARDPDSRRRGLGGPMPRFDFGVNPRIEPAPRRVTVLLVMDVGKTGIRRWSKTADPMLCVQEFCFLSRGPDKSAIRHTRRVAFGPGVALGQRGLACRSSPACVFRNVDLGASEARLQPIDLKILRHDRREAELVRGDESCQIEAGELVCEQPVIAETWRAWIVPETVAEAAGTRALKRALANGLGHFAAVEAGKRRR